MVSFSSYMLLALPVGLARFAAVLCAKGKPTSAARTPGLEQPPRADATGSIADLGRERLTRSRLRRTSISVSRRGYLDWLRGVAVLIMVEAHLFDAWVRVIDRSRHRTDGRWS